MHVGGRDFLAQRQDEYRVEPVEILRVSPWPPLRWKSAFDCGRDFVDIGHNQTITATNASKKMNTNGTDRSSAPSCRYRSRQRRFVGSVSGIHSST